MNTSIHSASSTVGVQCTIVIDKVTVIYLCVKFEFNEKTLHTQNYLAYY